MNLTWSMDFMEDRLENGRKVRILNIIDDFNREAITMEIGYSFTSNRVVEFVKQAIEWRGRPMQNGYVERFNRSYREAVLDAFIFENLNQYKTETEMWMEDYKNHHPHESLGDKTPIEFLQMSKVNSNSRETD